VALTLGTRIGVYDVTAPIGEGGMGQVYRAHDTKLNRDVALKVLSDSFANDPDRLARFTREAQTLASLNHPNIAHIHGLEESGGVRALVMELVEGDDLSQRLTRGAIPLDDALAVAKQIAEALEAAHEQGIIHRDLKPANVKVRADGVVKVLDFGLAKALEAVEHVSGSGPREASAAMPATVTSPATQVGMILGTAAYMAPEQARGLTVDRRADIWAFGCVLFEMLTGRRAFDAEDVSLTLARVLERDPDYALLPPNVPGHVAQTLRMCLRKDRRTRLSDIRDVRLALEGAFGTSVDAATVAGLRPRNWARPLPLTVAAALLLAAGGVGGWLLRPPANPPSAEPVRLSVLVPPAHEYALSTAPSHALAISPDGTRIVMRISRDDQGALYQRTLAGGTLEQIPGTEGGIAQPTFSPDGTQLAYIGGDDLKTVGFDGRPPVTVVPKVGTGSTVVWRGDALIFWNSKDRALCRVPAAGGTPERIATLASGSGTRVAGVHNSADILRGVRIDGTDRIEIVASETGQSSLLLENARLVVHTASAHLVFERDGELMAATLDPVQRHVGPVVPVLRGHAYDAAQYVPQVAVSDSGTLVYVVDVPTAPPTLAWVDASGQLTPAAELPAHASSVDLSDRSSLAVVGLSGAPRRVILWDMQRQVPTGLQVEGMTPRWHPDGRRFAVSKGDRVVLVDAEDGRETVLVSTKSGGLRTPSFSADGTLAYVQTAGASADIYALSPGGTEPRPVLATDAVEHSPALSPDGKWLAYVEGTRSTHVYVARFPSGAARRRVTTNAGNQPLWRQDSKALFYREDPDRDGPGRNYELRMVTVEGGDTLHLGNPHKLFSVVSPSAALISTTFQNEGAAFHASSDGRRFLMVYGPQPKPLTELAVVQNWFTELQRVVPRSSR
jgi:serine/threonine protein kinase/Tol biopolymer transport system component